MPEIGEKIAQIPADIVHELGVAGKDVMSFVQNLIPKDENGKPKITMAEIGALTVATLGAVLYAEKQYRQEHPQLQNASIPEVLKDMKEHPQEALVAARDGLPVPLRRGVDAVGHLLDHFMPQNTSVDSLPPSFAPDHLDLPQTGPIRPQELITPENKPINGEEMTTSNPSPDTPTQLKMPDPTSPLYHPDRNPFTAFIDKSSQEKPNPPTATTGKTRLVFTRPGFEGYSIHPNVKRAARWLFSPYAQHPQDKWMWQK